MMTRQLYELNAKIDTIHFHSSNLLHQLTKSNRSQFLRRRKGDDIIPLLNNNSSLTEAPRQIRPLIQLKKSEGHQSEPGEWKRSSRLKWARLLLAQSQLEGRVQARLQWNRWRIFRTDVRNKWPIYAQRCSCSWKTKELVITWII